MLREELRINSARMRRVPPNRRPQYTGLERMAILQLRAMRGWNKSETSRHFLVSDDTIRDWLRRVDDDALVQTPTPVNRFPDVVRYAVQQIKLFCPTLGKLKIAEKLARAGIHIGKTTVERILKERPVEPPNPTDDNGDQQVSHRIEISRPHLERGFDGGADFGRLLDAWIPTSISQRWPVCWWVLNVIDHFSRRSMGCRRLPEPADLRRGHCGVGSHHVRGTVQPKHLIVDQGSEFKCEHFEHVWCKAKNILPRFGAVGQHGSIAVVERFHRTLKEILRLTTIPEDQTEFERELGLIIDWYNEHRPHETLDGKTPNEVHFSRPAANEQPRFEPRRKWPRGSPCATPQVGMDGDPGDPIVFEIDCLEGRRHLPVIRVRRAA